MKNLLLLLVFVVLASAGCSGSQDVVDGNVITVEGHISQRGNSPFQAWMLETDQRNSYVLVMDATGGQYSSSKSYSVTGRLYKDQWNGKDYAHLEVYVVTEITP